MPRVVTGAEWRSGRVSSHDDAEIRGDPKLGTLAQLKGTWQNIDGFEGRMWNMIALPFGPPERFKFRYRLLLNQGHERLRFSVGDVGVANRGLDQRDQHLAALLYLQEIDQIMAVDAAVNTAGGVSVPATPDKNDTPKGDKIVPEPGEKPSDVGIHRETGLLLRLGGLAGPCDNLTAPGPDIARLASIPHGDSVMAMGFDGAKDPTLGAPNFADPDLIAAFDPLPIGIGPTDLNQPFLAPYKVFADAPFKGNVTKPGFKGFDPTHPLGLLASAFDPGKVRNTTTLRFDSDASGGITNIPFINCQASTTKVTAVFWIQEIDLNGEKRFLLQYAQRVLLEFLDRVDGQPGLIRWPHITINTLIRSPVEGPVA